MNVRGALYLASYTLRGSRLPYYERRYVREDEARQGPDATRRLLVQMLDHCQHSVPYYAAVMRDLGDWFRQDPEAYLAHMPILTKKVIRQEFVRLQSADLARRRWFVNTSGSSTGEPVKLVQDDEHRDRSYAITLLFSRWAGKVIGEPEIRIWGSERDILDGSSGLRASLASRLSNIRYLNHYRMTREQIRTSIRMLNAQQPKLITAYVQALYEIARVAQEERLTVLPQKAIITSAGTLYPFMRQKIETVFQCKVRDRYGCREAGDIACQCSMFGGLHVAPWGCYVEIVDDEGGRVPPGVEGNILITCLTNYAMPLIRYRMEDRGALATAECPCGRCGQILQSVSGRVSDSFRRRDGTLIQPRFFVDLLDVKDWVAKFQVIQKDYAHIVFRIVRCAPGDWPAEIEDLAAKTRLIIGLGVQVDVEFVDDIPSLPSGKYRYLISEIQE
ncbi:MAG: phenylacetate--CoA ligase family protein [Anaerolineae bacterium]